MSDSTEIKGKDGNVKAIIGKKDTTEPKQIPSIDDLLIRSKAL